MQYSTGFVGAEHKHMEGGVLWGVAGGGFYQQVNSTQHFEPISNLRGCPKQLKYLKRIIFGYWMRVLREQTTM